MSVFSPLMKFPNSFFKTKNIWLFLIFFSPREYVLLVFVIEKYLALAVVHIYVFVEL